MTDEDAYREADDHDPGETYRELVGPGGFWCTLTEPEDRTWCRDLSPVVRRLNEYHRLLGRVEEILGPLAHREEVARVHGQIRRIRRA